MLKINSKQAVSIPPPKEAGKFYCPVMGCLHGEDGVRFFNRKTYLAQHIGKVHAEKIYSCKKCSKGFGLEWQCRNHEEFCGKTWYCSCGNKYVYRESLLTHVRRTDHALPEDSQIKPKKLFRSKSAMKQNEKPKFIILQPVIQQHHQDIVPFMKNTMEQRMILPKVPDTRCRELTSINPVDFRNAGALQAVNRPIVDANAAVPNLEAPDSDVRCASQSVTVVGEEIPQVKSGYEKMAAQTQTYEIYLEAKPSKRKASQKLESRGSQCSGRKRTTQVGISSTQTQTLESAVGKMNKRNGPNKSRKKSVAVITGEDLPAVTQELWSDFENFLLSMDKYSSATQTNSYSDAVFSNKVLKDSQTVTENDVFLCLDSDAKQTGLDQVCMNSINDANKADLADIHVNASLQNNALTSNCEEIPNLSDAALSQKLTSVVIDCKDSGEIVENREISMIGCSPYCAPDGVTVGDIKKPGDLIVDTNLDSVCSTDSVAAEQTEASAFNRAMDLMLGEQFAKSEGPLLSDIQTQTNGPDALFNCELFDLTNMETQTTEDLLFPDLEFSDIETQTQWDDFQAIGDSLPVDQLSIEIQTDFSSAYINSSGVLDGNYVGYNPNQIGGPSTYSSCTFGRHIETQTQNDTAKARELIHSESQTHYDMGLFEI